ncbi:MAG: hypothetical protein IANPNBLG_02813 [Bryobacteraceae bacterium]|nr:hypothetical protein [Bryobacteraceae bacterium]
MKRSPLRGNVRVAVSLFMFAAPLLSQSEKARLTGVISDSTGAVVPGVRLTVSNRGTGEKRTVESNEAGAYTLPLLEPGIYDISTTKEGFRTVTRSGIDLHVNQTLRVDFRVEVGAVTESVQVSASQTALQTSTSDLGHTVDNRQVVDLPLNGRNTIALAALAPGIRPQGTFGSNPATVNYTGWGNFSANGGISNANEVLIDGTPGTTAALNGAVVMPPVDATEEFKVQTNNFAAEFDRTAGGIINLSLKSGTNRLHGTLYEFLRNDKFDASNFFSNRAGSPKPLLRYNQFGGSVGGPIKKDRTFFFGLYEGFRQNLGRVYTATVPTDRERSGDFSDTRVNSGAIRTIYDPLSTRRSADGRTYVRDPFPGNVIAPDRLDPVAVKLSSYLFPLPNTAGAQFTRVNNFGTSSGQRTDQDNFIVKIDHRFSDKHRLAGSYSYMKPSLSGWDPLNNKTTPADDGAANVEKTQFVSLNDSYVFGPATILDVRASYLRFLDERIPMSYGIDLTRFGFPKSYDDGVTWRHVPNIHVAGMADFSASTGSTIFGIQNNYSVGGSLTAVRGSHILKVGAQYRVMQNNRTQSNNSSGDYSFDPAFTRQDPLTTSLTSGYGYSSFLMGYAAAGSVQKVERLALESKYVGWYLQDDWRVSKKLTLNLGIRYSIEPFLTERFNRLSRFDPDAIPVDSAKYTGLPLKGGLVFMSKGDRSPSSTFGSQFSPRFGLAYTLTSKTVVRGGYGIFWLANNLAITNGNGNNPAYSVSTPFLSSIDGGITPSARLSNPFPTGFLAPPGSAAGADTLIGQSIGTYMEGIRPGYMQQWNFDLQREVGHGLVVDAAYAGSKGTRLPHGIGLNQLPNNFLALRTALNDPVPNPFFGLVTAGSMSGRTITRQQTLLPYPQFTGISNPLAPVGNSTYHALQLKVTQRFSTSGFVTAAYTLGKSITDTESFTAWLEPGRQNAGYYDQYNRRLDKSLANFDSTHRLVVSYNYELPFGRGKALLADARGIGGVLVSGWQINGITTLQSGYPVSVGRPNVVGDPNQRSAADPLYGWFNTAAFAPVPAFTWGNAPRVLPNTRSDSAANFDFSVFKNTLITEQMNLQFRSEFFNIFNHPWFARPDSSFGNASFGTVNTVLNNPRQVQFALKLIF